MIVANPIGILIAAIFASSMITLFIWMFRVPPMLPLPAVRAHVSLEAVRKILVPLVQVMPSERAVELACRLGNGKKVTLVLVHVIVVPFTLPLDADMPEREQVGHEVLKLGGTIAHRYGCQVQTRIVRHRSATEGVLKVADEESVDAIVLGVGFKKRVPGDWGKTSSEILRRATCEVILDKVPIAAQPLTMPA